MTRTKEDIKKYQKEYRDSRKEQSKLYDQSRYAQNKEYFETKNSDYYLENRETIINRSSKYVKDNKEEVKEYRKNYIKNKRNTDVNFNLRSQVSKNINRILRSQGSSKNNSSILNYLPYSMLALKEHIEKQFESWMNWNNWGLYNATTWNDNDPTTWTWNIDHIIPQSKLLYTSMTDSNFVKCWALNNLRPLSAKQNVLDGNRR